MVSDKRLELAVQFRRLRPHGRSRGVAIPPEMLQVLGWVTREPVRVELLADGRTIQLTQPKENEK